MNTQLVSCSAVCACGLLLGLALLGGSSNAQSPSPSPVSPSTEATVRYRVIDLGTLGGSRSEAYGINNKGQVVGGSFVRRDNSWHAFLYERGKRTDLGLLSGCFANEATGINNQGVIVGSARSGGPHIIDTHTFVYQQGKMEEFNFKELKFAARQWPRIVAINDAGHYAGHCTFNGYTHAFLYRDTVQDLGTLEGDEGRSEAFGINNKGQVVGVSWTSNYGDTRAVLFTDGHIIDLGVLPHDYASQAQGINSQGDIVGWSEEKYIYKVRPAFHAFLYHEHTMVDLNTLVPAGCGWVLSNANGINDSGQIVGFGKHGGKLRAFLLLPLSSKQ